MKKPRRTTAPRRHRILAGIGQRGFALVSALSMMVLLTLLAVGLLSLSVISLRNSTQGQAQAEARANARMALMVALGELQKQMGPDMRVSAESSLFDTNPDTPDADGVTQARWLGVYHSWGDWLNASYQPPGGSSLRIQDTYVARRTPMFRRWLLSLPDGSTTNSGAPLAASLLNDTNSAILVGEGSLGSEGASRKENITRAFLTQVESGGRSAWWIGAENQKAKATLASSPRNLSPAEWAVSQGNTAEVGVGGINGFGPIDGDPAVSSKLISDQSIAAAGVEPADVKRRFFDVTTHGQGVVTSVRSGHLKKDLSLMFELGSSALPAEARFTPGRSVREPSIRPMSPELLAKRPAITNRHFASWTNMRHYYRMYRRSSDANVGEMGGIGTVSWDRSKPWTQPSASVALGRWGNAWDGSNNYWRVPIMAKITFIYSLVSEPNPSQPGKFNCFHVYSPVFTLWNPYNVEMRIPDNKVEYLTSAYKVWPNSGTFWLGNTINKSADDLGAFGTFGYSQGVNTQAKLRSGRSGGDIIFKPGEFRVFSLQAQISNSGQAGAAELLPGFDPRAIGGEKKLYGSYSPTERPGITVEFSHNYWGGNINYGNTCGSLCMVSWFDRAANPGAVPINYAHDWLNKAQRRTPITPPGLTNVSRWNFGDSFPVPVAFCQLVLKGLSEFNYESIDWEQDWRSRNWIQAPPFYFGSGQYISEDDTIANTQRTDNPYVVFFGPTSMAEMPKVVANVGSAALLGSGSNPFEKVNAVPALELPTAPISSLAGFANMRINPGWTDASQLASHLSVNTYSGNAVQSFGAGESLYAAETKRVVYQSGITGPGIGNSFMHPMLDRADVYKYFNNSVSQDILDRSQPDNTKTNDTMAYSDYWDHVFLLNDALWDDYFVSSLADQTRPGASGAASLSENFTRLVTGEKIANSRFKYHAGTRTESTARAELAAAQGYLKAAGYLMIDGMFNVNSTSVDAWFSLFAGIRERRLVMRDSGGSLRQIDVPSGKRIALSRFEVELTNQEMDDPETGVRFNDGSQGWSGVRYLDDDQLMKLAEECVKQVKRRGPFLNFAEFINRRLSNDDLGLRGALQAAIDYDDNSPDARSINYRFKNGPDFMIPASAASRRAFGTPQAMAGSRFAGIPGYVIQSDLLRPIANTMSVRDDTFRIRGYGESLDSAGKVVARAWCEAIVQRMPEYCDPTNAPDVPARNMGADGRFSDNSALTETNRRFGRQFRIESFRWLTPSEV